MACACRGSHLADDALLVGRKLVQDFPARRGKRKRPFEGIINDAEHHMTKGYVCAATACSTHLTGISIL